MTLEYAEIVKQKLEQTLKKETNYRLKEMEIFVAPSAKQDFTSFIKMWRNSTYVVALATVGHMDMNVYVCDSNFNGNEDQFETFNQFAKRINLSI